MWALYSGRVAPVNGAQPSRKGRHRNHAARAASYGANHPQAVPSPVRLGKGYAAAGTVPGGRRALGPQFMGSSRRRLKGAALASSA